MKNLISILSLSFVLLLASAGELAAQKVTLPGLDKSPHDIAYSRERRGDVYIKVLYGRPQLKGRSMSSLAPNGKVWRTGANEATEIKFYQDVSLGDTKVAAGTYSLFAIPGEKEWIIIISKDTDVWGAYFYKEENDAARLSVPVQRVDETVEAFTIAFKKVDTGAHMLLSWGDTKVEVPFGF